MGLDKRTIIMTVTIIVTILALVLVVSSPGKNVDATKGHDNYFQQEINDGLNQPFNQNTFYLCGSPFEEGL